LHSFRPNRRQHCRRHRNAVGRNGIAIAIANSNLVATSSPRHAITTLAIGSDVIAIATLSPSLPRRR
jgi:hypothetical protein